MQATVGLRVKHRHSSEAQCKGVGLTCRATIFLWRSVRMMATSRLRSLRGFRFFLPLDDSMSTFFTICTPMHQRRQLCGIALLYDLKAPLGGVPLL